MNTFNKFILSGITILLLSGCSSSDGTSSTGGGGSGSTVNLDASSCVSRSLRKLYVNECNYAINTIIFEAGQTPFRINPNDAVSRSSTGNSFGACRAPSQPVLNSDISNFTCS